MPCGLRSSDYFPCCAFILLVQSEAAHPGARPEAFALSIQRSKLNALFSFGCFFWALVVETAKTEIIATEIMSFIIAPNASRLVLAVADHAVP